MKYCCPSPVLKLDLQLYTLELHNSDKDRHEYFEKILNLNWELNTGLLAREIGRVSCRERV